MTPVFKIQKSADRHHTQAGWLDTHYSFSFADYHDLQNLNWGPLRVFNDDWIAAKNGFGMHPHQNMEILTYVLQGELEHQDSMGHRGMVKPGCVQYMSAGTGVVHAEKNSGDKPLHLCQMWVLPDRPMHKPQYGQLDLKESDRKNRLLKVAAGDASAPIQIHQDAALYLGKLENKNTEHRFEKNRMGFLFIAEGHLTANGHALETGDAVRMANLEKLTLEGTGEVVLWDLAPLTL